MKNGKKTAKGTGNAAPGLAKLVAVFGSAAAVAVLTRRAAREEDGAGPLPREPAPERPALAPPPAPLAQIERSSWHTRTARHVAATGIRGKMALTMLLLLVMSTWAVASFEGFSSTATNPTSSPYDNFATGSVTLADDSSATALFSLSGIDPPASGSACIAVQYTGSVTNGADVYLYATNVSDTNSLGTFITLAVQDGTDTQSYATGDATCAHFTANGTTTAASHTTVGHSITALAINSWPTTDATGYALGNTGSGAGAQAWSTNPTTVWYKFSYSVSSSAPASSSSQIQLTWEADGQ